MVYTANIVRLHLISKYRDWEQLSYDDFGGSAVGVADDIDACRLELLFIIFVFWPISVRLHSECIFFLVKWWTTHIQGFDHYKPP